MNSLLLDKPLFMDLVWLPKQVVLDSLLYNKVLLPEFAPRLITR
jgi:hypothetical protein